MFLYENDIIEINGDKMPVDKAKLLYTDLKTEIEFNQILRAIAQIMNRDEIKNETNAMKKAFYLFKYIIENSTYDINIQQEKQKDAPEELEFHEIYRCLCEKRSVCTGDSATLALLLRKAGIPSTHIGLADKKTSNDSSERRTGAHEVVKFQIDDKDFFCDPTLFRMISQQNNIEIDKLPFALSLNQLLGQIYPRKEIVQVWRPFDINVIFLSANSVNENKKHL